MLGSMAAMSTRSAPGERGEGPAQAAARSRTPPSRKDPRRSLYASIREHGPCSRIVAVGRATVALSSGGARSSEPRWRRQAMKRAEDPATRRRTLDLRGIRCPLSWAKARVVLETLARGDELELVVDDAQAARDIPRAAEAVGHHVAAVTADPPSWRITIEV